MSLDECYGRVKLENMFEKTVCTKTLYNYVKLGFLKIKNIDLPQKLKRSTKAIKIDSKSCKPVNDALSSFIMKSGSKIKEVFKSVTSDNGSGFSGLSDLESLISIYIYQVPNTGHITYYLEGVFLDRFLPRYHTKTVI